MAVAPGRHGAPALATCGLVRDPQLPDLPAPLRPAFPASRRCNGWASSPSQDADGHVATINSEVNKALRDPNLVAKLAQQGTTAAGTTPEEFRTLIATEIKTWKETAERAGLEPQ